jgi:hypothetical protein
LNLLFPDQKDVHNKAMVKHYLNGDWQSPSIVHYCPDGHCPVDCSSGAFGQHVAGQLGPILVGRLLKVFPRHRWTGAEVTLRDASLLVSPHRMLEACGPVWLVCCKQHRDPTKADFDKHDGSRLEPAAISQHVFRHW